MLLLRRRPTCVLESMGSAGVASMAKRWPDTAGFKLVVGGAEEAATALHSRCCWKRIRNCSCGAGYCLGGPKNADKMRRRDQNPIAHKNQLRRFLRAQYNPRRIRSIELGLRRAGR